MNVPGTHIEKPTATPRSGNAFSVLAACAKAMRRSGVPEGIITKYMDDAKSGDFDHLLQVSMDYCDLEID